MEYLTLHRPDHPRASASGCVPVHILVVEAAIGHFLPAGAEVHHFDEDKQNNTRRNLVACQDKGYHKLLHYRARLIRAGVNPNTHKICGDCREAKLLSEFAVMRANKSSGRQSRCRACGQAHDVGRPRRGSAA